MFTFARTLTFVLAASGLLMAQGDGPGRGPGHGPRMGRPALACLDLTDAQKAQFKAIDEKHRPSLETKGQAAREAGDALRKAMMDPATPEATLKALHAKAGDARFAMMMEHRQLRAEQFALLTADQKAKLEKLRAERQAQMKERGQGRGPHHGGPGFGAPEPR